MRNANYYAGMASIAGLPSDQQFPEDLPNAKKALGLLQASYAEAKTVIATQDSLTATLKAKVTGVNLDAMRGEVKMLGEAVDRMQKVYDGFDVNTPHDKVVDFVKSCNQIADITVLKESANRNQLVTLAKEVGSETIKEIVHQVEKTSTSLWDAIPTSFKIVGGVGVILGVGLAVNSRLK